MAKKINLYDLTKIILKEDEKSRSSDKILFLRVIKEMGLVEHEDKNLMGRRVVIRDWDSMPQFESVSRARRKVQEQHEELRGSNYNKRQENQKDYLISNIFQKKVNAEIKCDYCGKILKEPKWFYIIRNNKRIKLPFCSKRCADYAEMSAE